MSDAYYDKKWHFVDHRGARHGPVHQAHLKWAAKKGYLLPTSLVWTQGQADWLPSHQVLPRDLFEGIALPPPLPHEKPQPEDIEEVSPAPPPEDDFGESHQLLFKWLKNFDTNLRVFPARAVRAGFQITAHRHPSKTTNIFEGEVALGSKPTKVQVVLGTKPIVGGIMRMNVPRQAVSKEDLRPLARDAETWFNRHWSGEARIPWAVWAIGICIVPIVIVSVLLFEALAPGRVEAAWECRRHLSAYITVETLDQFDYDRALFRPVDWHVNQARSVNGEPIKCIVIPQSGRLAYLGACDWTGNAGDPPQTDFLSCLAHYNKSEARWAIAP